MSTSWMTKIHLILTGLVIKNCKTRRLRLGLKWGSYLWRWGWYVRRYNRQDCTVLWRRLNEIVYFPMVPQWQFQLCIMDKSVDDIIDLTQGRILPCPVSVSVLRATWNYQTTQTNALACHYILFWNVKLLHKIERFPPPISEGSFHTGHI